MKKLYLGFYLLLSVAALGQDKIISVIGSSTAQGIGALPVDSSWVRRLSHYYKNQVGEIDTIYNLALGGSNNYHGMPSSYVPPPFRDLPDVDLNITRALSLNPDVVIISYVSNGLDFYSTAEVMLTLQTMKDSANAAGKVCFITTTQPRTGFTPAGREQLRVLKDSILNHFGIFAINFFDPVVDPVNNTIRMEYRFPSDDVHLNNAGHRVLFEQVLAKDILNAVLPVTITGFSGSLVNDKVVLTWSAHDEEVPTLYAVQRSTNGNTFETLQQIPAKAGAGEMQYTYIDRNPAAGTNFYRLGITEPTGKSFSKVISVNKRSAGFKIKKVYGTRSSQFITANIISPKPQTIKLELINSSGMQLKIFTRNLHRGENIVTLPVTGLTIAAYFVRVTGADEGVLTQPVMCW